jgi:hypothetical protein
MEARNRFQGMNSASLCSLGGRYDNPNPPRFLAPIDSLKIPALINTYKGAHVFRFMSSLPLQPPSHHTTVFGNFGSLCSYIIIISLFRTNTQRSNPKSLTGGYSRLWGIGLPIVHVLVSSLDSGVDIR